MIRASAPGSIMITGEHAVVYGHRAIVAAIAQRAFVSLTPRDDDKIYISSEIADPLVTNLEQISVSGPYKFVLAAIEKHKNKINTGCDIAITSQIDPTLGLGSSAAITIATLGALHAWMGLPADNIHALALEIVCNIQGRGSGADLAASFTGGMLAYRGTPDVEIAKLPSPPAFSLKNVGYKTPTSEVLQIVAQNMQGRETEYKTLYEHMGAEAETAIASAKLKNWDAFAKSLNTYQDHMRSLGVSDDNLERIITDANAEGSAMALKISGSGLGDCVLALGDAPKGFSPAPLDAQGLIIHD